MNLLNHFLSMILQLYYIFRLQKRFKNLKIPWIFFAPTWLHVIWVPQWTLTNTWITSLSWDCEGSKHWLPSDVPHSVQKTQGLAMSTALDWLQRWYRCWPRTGRKYFQTIATQIPPHFHGVIGVPCQEDFHNLMVPFVFFLKRGFPKNILNATHIHA
jgi:hypothetical protein